MKNPISISYDFLTLFASSPTFIFLSPCSHAVIIDHLKSLVVTIPLFSWTRTVDLYFFPHIPLSLVSVDYTAFVLSTIF